MRGFRKENAATSGECVGKLFGLLSPLALLACGVEIPVDGGELGRDEDVATDTQAVTTCYVSYQFGNPSSQGRWKRLLINPPCGTFDPTLSFQFGLGFEKPFMVGDRIATLGFNGDRFGRMFIDQDRSHSWSAGDTNKRFMPTPESRDLPFSIHIRKTKRGPSCEPVTGLGAVDYVAGIFRDGEWHIDQNGNGIWDGVGPGRCDLWAKFGEFGDTPVPLRDRLAVARAVSPELHWIVDEDRSFSFSGFGPGRDAIYKSFGNDRDRPFSSSVLGQHGVQRERLEMRPNGEFVIGDVFLNNDSDRNWSAGDIEALGHVPLTDLPRVVGWYAVTFPH